MIEITEELYFRNVSRTLSGYGFEVEKADDIGYTIKGGYYGESGVWHSDIRALFQEAMRHADMRQYMRRLRTA